MKKLTIEDVTIQLIVEQDEIPVQGNAIESGDKEFDEKVENEIIERLESGDVWAWASVEVKATYKGLEASDYLGCCSYKDAAEFKADGYYTDMVSTVLDDINKQVAEIVTAVKGCIHEQSNDLIISQYPIQDETWPSRRWNAERTEYADLSGCDCKN